MCISTFLLSSHALYGRPQPEPEGMNHGWFRYGQVMQFQLRKQVLLVSFHGISYGAQLEPKFLTPRPTIVFPIHMGTPMVRSLIFDKVFGYLIIICVVIYCCIIYNP